MTKRRPQTLIIRADADVKHGMGHVMRSLALASAWCSRGGSVAFLSTGLTSSLQGKVRAVGATPIAISNCYPDVVDLWTTLNYAATAWKNQTRLWVLLDGYHFDAEYHERIRAAGCALLVIDDNGHLPFYSADIVLNHGIHARYLNYRCDRDCTLLLGSHYALLRHEFTTVVTLEKVTPPTARKILITLGGSDPSNASEKVIRALAHTNLEFEARVVVGPLNPHLQSLRAVANEVGPFVMVESSIGDMVSRMLWADLAISGAGGTCWELAALGVPMINLIVAENQAIIGAEVEKSGASICLGWDHSVTIRRIANALEELARAPSRRERMKQAGKALVDGKGVERVVEAMMQKEISRAA